jgi:excisionase family DNA binding protein
MDVAQIGKKEKPCDRFLSVSTVAGLLDCSDQFVYAMIRSGELKAIKIGSKAVRVSLPSLEDYINSNWIDPDTYFEPEVPERSPVRKVAPQTIARSKFMTSR